MTQTEKILSKVLVNDLHMYFTAIEKSKNFFIYEFSHVHNSQGSWLGVFVLLIADNEYTSLVLLWKQKKNVWENMMLDL